MTAVIDYEKLLSEKVRQIKPSGIRKFFDIANEMDGVISLSVGEPDFKTPFAIREEGIRTLERGKTWYSANAGMIELREEICRYLERRFGLSYEPKGETLVTVGGSEAIDLCFRALLDPGDEVLVPEPSFVCYTPLAEMIGAVPVPIRTRERTISASPSRSCWTPSPTKPSCWFCRIRTTRPAV